MKCVCDLDNGNTIEVYVKYRGFHNDLNFDHLTAELVANQFAVDLGLPAAEPCLVNVSDDFLSTLPNDNDAQQVREAFNYADGIAFGSVAFSTVRRWQAQNLVHIGQLDQAIQLYLFDTLIENTDRGIGNTNLLILGSDFKVIDFGHSFQRCHSDTANGFGSKPWETNGIQNHIPGNLQHALYENLKNRVTEAMINGFCSNLQNLLDDVIEAYVTIVSAEWGQDCACNIIGYLLEARANSNDFGARAKEVLL